MKKQAIENSPLNNVNDGSNKRNGAGHDNATSCY
jgi:hypothetical protein